MDSDVTAGEPVLFEATIVPYRSLSPRGVCILVAVIALCCALTVLRFLLLRAWPVVGFSVVEVTAAILLIRYNSRCAGRSELVLLTGAGLHVIRTDAFGRRQTEVLPSGWLNVVLDEVPGRIPRLLLVSRALRCEIGAALGEAEKRDLAGALSTALHRLRNPIFDNPQLRD